MTLLAAHIVQCITLNDLHMAIFLNISAFNAF